MTDAAHPKQPSRRLCALADIADGQAADFTVDDAAAPRAIFVVRKGERAFGYVNSCPHVGAPLNFQPGVFMNMTGTHIQCSTHGALFRIEDGVCVMGPCKRQQLEAVAVRVDGGDVFLA